MAREQIVVTKRPSPLYRPIRKAVVPPHACRLAPDRAPVSALCSPRVDANMKRNKMVDRFSETQMLKLVEIYKEHNCLWDVTHDLYKNKDARDSAYKQICEKLNIPGLRARDVPQKIKNLRSSYYQEMKKVEYTLKEGATKESAYKPKVSWFTIADGFLRTYYRSQHDRFVTISESLKKEAAVKIHRTQTQEAIASLDAMTAVKVAPRTKKKPRLSQHNENTRQNVKPQSENEDECDSFGKYIATTLRSMPREMSIVAKTELQNTLSEIQLRSVRQRNNSILPPQSDASTSSSCNQQLEFTIQPLNVPVSQIKTEFEDW